MHAGMASQARQANPAAGLLACPAALTRGLLLGREQTRWRGARRFDLETIPGRAEPHTVTRERIWKTALILPSDLCRRAEWTDGERVVAT